MIPPAVEVPATQRGEAKLRLRYEDIAPDGRLLSHVMPQAIGAGFWQAVAPRFGIGEARRTTGIVPILSRLITEAGEGPVGLLMPVRVQTRFALARVEEEGLVRRILLEVWADLHAPRGKVHGDPPPGVGEEILAGRVYAEHVFTRPFASPEQRRVTRLEHEGLAEVPERRVRWSAPDALAGLPEGAEPLDEALLWDDAPVVFGLDHCDSNQHVNSLVYPRLFRDAALRQLGLRHPGELGGAPRLTARQATAFRKPCFAGDRMRVALRGYRRGEAVGVVAALVSEAQTTAASAAVGRTAHAYGRLEL